MSAREEAAQGPAYRIHTGASNIQAAWQKARSPSPAAQGPPDDPPEPHLVALSDLFPTPKRAPARLPTDDDPPSSALFRPDPRITVIRAVPAEIAPTTSGATGTTEHPEHPTAHGHCPTNNAHSRPGLGLPKHTPDWCSNFWGAPTPEFARLWAVQRRFAPKVHSPKFGAHSLCPGLPKYQNGAE